ncbi:MAG: hypothetical protein ACKVIY_06535, partial [Acidimicrobiales bacterium]
PVQANRRCCRAPGGFNRFPHISVLSDAVVAPWLAHKRSHLGERPQHVLRPNNPRRYLTAARYPDAVTGL